MQVIFKKTPHTRKFGVELEVSPDVHKTSIGMILEDFELYYGTGRTVKVTPGPNGWDVTNSNNYWHVKYDSTCGPKGKPHDYGWEIASFIGRSEEDLDIIAGAAEYLAESGVLTNNNCGYHIHIDVSDFTPEKIGLLIARWLKIEFSVMSACPIRRINNPHCQFLNFRRITQNASYNPERLVDFWNRMAPENLGNHDNVDKRYTVNTIGYRTGQINDYHPRKTVEFRFPECLLNRQHIANWVMILLCFVDDCYKAETPPKHIQKCESLSESLQLMGLQGNDNFFYLLDEKLCDAKIWFLQKIKLENTSPSYAQEAEELLAFIQKI